MSSLKDNFEFDFDYWADLAQKDPEAFDAQKKQMTEQFINNAPEQQRQRLRGLQWRIDNEVKLSKTPLEGCLKVHRMMMARVYDEGGLLDQINRLTEVFDERPTLLNMTDMDDSNKTIAAPIDLSSYRKL